MASEITMPQLSDTMTEGTVVKWHKKEGDAIKSGDEIADVETDKATMPMETFDSGTLAYIAVSEGQKVGVGQLIAVVATAGEDVAEVKKRAQAGAGSKREPAAQPHGATPSDMEADPSRPAGGRAASRADAGGGESTAVGVAVQVLPAEPVHAAGGDRHPGERIRISPLARRIAEDKNVPLEQVRGSGPGGRIVERDIQRFLREGGSRPAPSAASTAAPTKASPAAPQFAPIVARGQTKTVAMTKMRSAIAMALQRSKQLVPHFYETLDVDVEELLAARQRVNKKLEKENVRLSIADFIYKAVATSLLAHPAINARFNAEKGEATQYGDVNLGIAVAIPDGLIVPVLRGVDQMGLREIRARSLDLIERARNQRLRREEQSEATFTITSLGSQGIREFSAIINPPEVGILAVGSAEKRAVAQGDKIVARTMMTLTLSADHRVVDGATAAEFLITLKSMLEEPAMLLV